MEFREESRLEFGDVYPEEGCVLRTAQFHELDSCTCAPSPTGEYQNINYIDIGRRGIVVQ